MTDPIPINLAAVEQRAGQKLGREILSRQVTAESRLIEAYTLNANNPAAAKREQNRLDQSRTLESRAKEAQAEQKILEVSRKTDEEDLAGNYNRRNPELPADRLRQLRDVLRPNQTAYEVLQEVTDAFDDPTLADEALEFLEKTTTGTLQGNVRGARELLNAAQGRQIIAGRNVDAVAKSYHKKGAGDSPTELRNLYRDITGNPRDHNTLFTELSARYPFDDLKLLVQFLLKGMAYDLKSKGPSIQSPELMRLMTEVRNLQSILGLFLFFRGRMKLLRHLFKRYGLTYSEDLTFELLTKEFIKLIEEKYPSVMKLFKQADKLGLLDDASKIAVLMQFRDAIRGVSPRVYKSQRHKQDIQQVILEALEELEEREGEEEGEQA